jgi:hypothetical protein
MEWHAAGSGRFIKPWGVRRARAELQKLQGSHSYKRYAVAKFQVSGDGKYQLKTSGERGLQKATERTKIGKRL